MLSNKYYYEFITREYDSVHNIQPHNNLSVSMKFRIDLSQFLNFINYHNDPTIVYNIIILVYKSSYICIKSVVKLIKEGFADQSQC